MARRSETISPTAHYTGYVWVRSGLSDPAFATGEGRLLHRLLAPAMAVSGAVGGPTLEGFLLARHRLIDELLTEAIERHGITQVVEIAAGLAARGWRFTRRHPDLTYLEADLPGMAGRKRRILRRASPAGPGHRVVELDVLEDGGLDRVVAGLDPARGLVIVTEGLVNYFDERTVRAMWSRFARALGRFERGRYLSDLHLATSDFAVRAFTRALSVFVRGKVHLHFDGEAAAERALKTAGFARAVLHVPPDNRLVRVIEADTVDGRVQDAGPER
ncbi:class I SAM-dependent methyltransferase [Amycolatopsis thermophila]|uniref:O-methyltransferase involved in polyketide biosynthesis n=1 Tax=Amycolatopsis thermophila TaxID=206084 RepID=A0ABU0ETY9_9PSEU|nr:class I SAM-dependent methyltransferase [Amycolatopsis thermophila]MDQ0378733.1 O-methyltransferase involved in polyketide biosynthesis [Amycolatopsis thermophila]